MNFYKLCATLVLLCTTQLLFPVNTRALQPTTQRKPIKAIYLPLADNYAGIVAYEKYRDRMTEAGFSIEQLPGPHMIPSRFREDDVDLAFTMSIQAMRMFSETPDFRWVSLMHRDGAALAINDIIKFRMRLMDDRMNRKPDYQIAEAFRAAGGISRSPVECSVPSLLSTQTVALFKYLRDHGMTLGYPGDTGTDVIAVEVPSALAPSFIRKKNSRGLPAAFVQSMPWADIVETQNFGYLAWYTRDVIPWPKGHVEGIVIAKKRTITEKTEALREVIHYLHQAGLDIEDARKKGGQAMADITRMINTHIPNHIPDAIAQSLRPDLNIINYLNLNIDKPGLRLIMDYAIECGLLAGPVDVELMADTSFSTKITEY